MSTYHNTAMPASPMTTVTLKHNKERRRRAKVATEQAFLRLTLKAMIDALKTNGATPDEVKAFYKGFKSSSSTYSTSEMEATIKEVFDNRPAGSEFYIRALAATKSEIAGNKLKPVYGEWAPLRVRLSKMEGEVQDRMRREIGKRLPLYMGAGEAPEGSIKVPTSHEKQVKSLGIREINGRFILSAEQVDEVGEFKLFQISYVTRGDSVASNQLQWGFVSTYNNGYWAFAQSPSRAMAAAKTNMVKDATRKLAR